MDPKATSSTNRGISPDNQGLADQYKDTEAKIKDALRQSKDAISKFKKPLDWAERLSGKKLPGLMKHSLKLLTSMNKIISFAEIGLTLAFRYFRPILSDESKRPFFIEGFSTAVTFYYLGVPPDDLLQLRSGAADDQKKVGSTIPLAVRHRNFTEGVKAAYKIITSGDDHLPRDPKALFIKIYMDLAAAMGYSLTSGEKSAFKSLESKAVSLYNANISNENIDLLP